MTAAFWRVIQRAELTALVSEGVVPTVLTSPTDIGIARC